MTQRTIRAWLLGYAAGLMIAEVLRPLRHPREPRARRAARNAAFGAIAATTVQVLEVPVVMPVARLVERRGLGLLPRLPLPGAVRTLLAVAALDYTLYLWHVLVHRVPALWRFHEVHHADRDLDALTAIRFHFGELAASVPWRAGQVALLGVPPSTLSTWQTLTLASVLFHHSNLRLPLALERALAWIVVTPRLHGIHHSRVADEMNSNWSSGFTVWDRLHGTFRDDVPQAAIDIGVPGFDAPSAVTLPKMLAAPFVTGLPEAGDRSERAPGEGEALRRGGDERRDPDPYRPPNR